MSARSRNTLTLIGYGLLLALVAIAVLLIANRKPASQGVILAEPPTPAPLRVHVTGAVAAPGVYALPAGSIVLDAITAAGGPLPEADQNVLNLARLVRDGDQVAVPLRAAAGTPVEGQAVGVNSAPGVTPAAVLPLNLNTATTAELETLPGIGPTLAQTIVDYRAEHGPFATIESILDVPGIGEGKFEAIKALVTV
jgi:competence protein ComEA